MKVRAGLVIVSTGLSVLACTGSDSLPAGQQALTYTIATVARESGRSDPPVVFIDGVAQRELELHYPHAIDALALHRVELHAGSAVVAALELYGPALADCAVNGSVVSFTDTVCEYDSGDLRLGPPTGTLHRLDGTEGQCILDGSASCGPRCTDATCGGGMRCTSIVTSHAPLYSHLGCAPIGTAAPGAPCTFAIGPAGDYDDCDAGSICVAGTCHALCTSSCTCGSIEGEPPELAICM